MAYKLNIKSGVSWINILKDSNIDVTDINGYFISTSLEGVLDELYLISTGQTLDDVTTNGNTTGNDITVENITSKSLTTDYVKNNIIVSGTPTDRGISWYDDASDTININHRDGVVQQVGEEFFAPPTHTTSGVTIYNGFLCPSETETSLTSHNTHNVKLEKFL